MLDVHSIIEKHYTRHTDLHFILVTHSHQVMLKALEVVDKHPELQADRDFVAEAAMLHDIGILHCEAPRIHCHGPNHYICHGYLGADMLRDEGLERHALVCERHTGVGISLDKIIDRNLPLPHRNMQPVSIEEQIVCFADKFYSKTELHSEHSLDRIRKSLGHHGAENVAIFDHWHNIFS